MDFKSILDIFDGSTFSEEYLSDYDKIQTTLDFELLKAANLTDPNERAWLKLRQSIFCMLKGNLKKAPDFLEEIFDIEGLAVNCSIRIKAYKVFYASLRTHPSIIRFRPLLAGPNSCFRTLENGLGELGHDLIDTYTDNLKRDTPFFRFETQIIIFLLTTSHTLWNGAYLQHPQYPKGPWEALRTESWKSLTGRVASLKGYVRHARQANMHQLAAYLLRLVTELEFGRSIETSDIVERLKTRYRTSVDKHNLAILKMLEADHILSPPFSNPIALNLMLIEGSQPGESIAPWDVFEAETQIVNVEAAELLYEQAYNFFSDSRSPRGQAAVRLRQGCLEHMQALAADVLLIEKTRRCELARGHFDDALRLFGLDEAHSQIVRGHQILLGITCGSQDSFLKQSRDIGTWGREANNEAISEFVGILMQRFGRRQMLEHSRNDVALKAYKCAQACFEGLNDRFGLFRSLTSELHLYYSMNDTMASLNLLEKVKAMFEESILLLDSMEEKYPPVKRSCEAMRGDVILVPGSLILSVYNSLGDTDGHKAWADRLEVLRNKHGSTGPWSVGWTRKQFHRYLFGSSNSTGTSVIIAKMPMFATGSNKGQPFWFFSILNMFCRFFGFQELKPRISILKYIKQGQENIQKYSEATSKWLIDIQNLDIDAAEKHLKQYIQETAPRNTLIHPECFFTIIAAAQMGDFETARTILRRMINRRFLEPNEEINLKPRQVRTSQELVQEMFTVDNVIATCAMSQDWVLGRRVLSRITQLYPEFLNIDSTSMTPSLWKRLAKIGIIYEHSNAPLEAFKILLKASQLAEQDRNSVGDSNSRRGIFDTDPLVDIFTGLARLCLRAADLGLPIIVMDGYLNNHIGVESWHEHALLFLEQAKARTLLDALTGTDLIDASARHLQISDGTTAKNLFEAIGPDEVVIEADYSVYGSTILGITSNGIEFAQQRSTRGMDMRRLAIKAMRHFHKHADEINEVERSTDQGPGLEVYLQKLSQELIEPLQHLIMSKRHVIFIVSQPLAAFPMSTLLLNGKPLFLHAAVSHAPSLRTLYHLWKSGKDSRMNCNPANTEMKSPISVCTIANSTVVTRGQNELRPDGALLHLAAIEAMVIARKFNTWPLEGSRINRSTLQLLLTNGHPPDSQNHGGREQRQTRIVHIGAHGDYDPNQPWKSYISLQEDFRVLDIQANSPMEHIEHENSHKTTLIVFAACLSGMGRSTSGNDVLGFSHALLQRSCSAYIGALWPVDDQVSMLLMVFFYRHVHECMESKKIGVDTSSRTTIAELWRKAQVDLYNLKKEKAREIINEMIKILDDAEGESCDPAIFVKKWRRRLERVLSNIESEKLDFKDPCHWGAFVVVGYGGLELGISQGEAAQETAMVNNSIAC